MPKECCDRFKVSLNKQSARYPAPESQISRREKNAQPMSLAGCYPPFPGGAPDLLRHNGDVYVGDAQVG